jgi:hypothetical protein
MNGSCQCGAITFLTPTLHPQKLYICHCLDCQRQSSSAFGISATFPYFKLASGLPLSCWTRITDAGARLKCYFCQKCGARILHVYEEDEKAEKGEVFVKGGCLEGLGKEELRGAIHIWCKRAVVDIPVGVRRYDEEPEY